MRKDKLYFLTFLSVTVIYLLVALVAIRFILKDTALELVAAQLELGKKEARTFAMLVGSKLENGITREKVVDNVQEGLNGTIQEKVFLSVIDWSGKIICHPEIKKVGQKIGPDQSLVSSVADNLSASDFYDLLIDRRKDLAILPDENKENLSEVIFMCPVQNSDWIVASSINLKNLDTQTASLAYSFYTIFAIIGLIIIPTFVITTRYIGSLYEKRLELQTQKLENEVWSLSKLNRAVGDYQQKVIEKPVMTSAKKRILTQLRNELLSVPTEEIALIYTENTITYVVCFDDKRSTTNASLDELFSQLDETTFFRANRQFIIAISSIDKIVKYGNSQLKILVTPDPKADILISKNRAAEFKNWLNL